MSSHKQIIEERGVWTLLYQISKHCFFIQRLANGRVMEKNFDNIDLYLVGYQQEINIDLLQLSERDQYDHY